MESAVNPAAPSSVEPARLDPRLISRARPSGSEGRRLGQILPWRAGCAKGQKALPLDPDSWELFD